MAYVSCMYCRHGYRAPLGRSACPECKRVNVKTGLLDGFSPVAKFLLVAALIFVVVVALGYGISVYDATN